jgi:hypothetical protein
MVRTKPTASTSADTGPKKAKTVDVNVTFQVVQGKIPPDLLVKLQRDFTKEEVEHIFARIPRTIAYPVEPPDRPAVLWVFGPSAVGKSSVTDQAATRLFGSPQNAVIVDGEYFREWHVGWRSVCLHGMQNHLLHKDAWSTFKNVKVPRVPARRAAAWGEGRSRRRRPGSGGRLVPRRARRARPTHAPSARRRTLLTWRSSIARSPSGSTSARRSRRLASARG